MSEKPRTWTLKQYLGGEILADGPSLIVLGETRLVVEAEPVADLLERLSEIIGEILPAMDPRGKTHIILKLAEIADERDALLRVLRPEGETR